MNEPKPTVTEFEQQVASMKSSPHFGTGCKGSVNSTDTHTGHTLTDRAQHNRREAKGSGLHGNKSSTSCLVDASIKKST